MLYLVPTTRWRPEDPVQALVQAPGVVLDPGGSGLFRRCSQHDRGLAASAVQENQGGGGSHSVHLPLFHPLLPSS